MSADNGFIVARLDQQKDEYGIFYYSGDSPDTFTRENAERVYTNPVHAILRAHALQSSERTEYGVSVRPSVLYDTKDYFPYNTNEIVKAGKQELPPAYKEK